MESLRSQQSEGAIFVPVSPRERTIAPFLRRVLTLSAQFPRIRTCSGQINLYRGEIAVEEIKVLVTTEKEWNNPDAFDIAVPGLPYADAVTMFKNLEPVNAPLTDDQVDEIVCRCRGVPLALQIARGLFCNERVGVKCDNLIRKLGMSGLTKSEQDGIEPEQILKMLIRTEYDYLDADLKYAFAACSTFSGSFSAEAGLAVIDCNSEKKYLNDYAKKLQKRYLLRQDVYERYYMPSGLRVHCKKQAELEFGDTDAFLGKFAFHVLKLLSENADQALRDASHLQLLVRMITMDFWHIATALGNCELLKDEQLLELRNLPGFLATLGFIPYAWELCGAIDKKITESIDKASREDLGKSIVFAIPGLITFLSSCGKEKKNRSKPIFRFVQASIKDSLVEEDPLVIISLKLLEGITNLPSVREVGDAENAMLLLNEAIEMADQWLNDPHNLGWMLLKCLARARRGIGDDQEVAASLIAQTLQLLSCQIRNMCSGLLTEDLKLAFMRLARMCFDLLFRGELSLDKRLSETNQTPPVDNRKKFMHNVIECMRQMRCIEELLGRQGDGLGQGDFKDFRQLDTIGLHRKTVGTVRVLCKLYVQQKSLFDEEICSPSVFLAWQMMQAAENLCPSWRPAEHAWFEQAKTEAAASKWSILSAASVGCPPPSCKLTEVERTALALAVQVCWCCYSFHVTSLFSLRSVIIRECTY